MDGRIKLEYLDKIKNTDQANIRLAAHSIRETFDWYMMINKHLLSFQFWNRMEAKQHVYVTNQNNESALNVIRNLKAAGAQRVDLEEIIELVCICKW